MADDYLDLNSKSAEEQESSEEDQNSSSLWRWAHFPAFAVFGLFFVLLHRYPCRWYVAIGASYTVLVYWLGFGQVLRDADDFLGNPEMQGYALRLLIPHLFFLGLVLLGVAAWFHLLPTLPPWATHEGRKESLWDLFGWLALTAAGITQGFWMANKIKTHFNEKSND